jgi:hypothetical protein
MVASHFRNWFFGPDDPDYISARGETFIWIIAALILGWWIGSWWGHDAGYEEGLKERPFPESVDTHTVNPKQIK